MRIFFSSFFQDTKTFFKKLSFPSDEKREVFFLIAVMLVALAYRLHAIQEPITYDESYTYLAFIRGSFIQTMTDYHLPNNHIFLSLILNLTRRIFGDAQWVLRMPTLIFGVLMIPATYAFGKRFYGKYAGLLAAVGVAVFPELIHYSSIFRGYILVALFTLWAFNLADNLRREKNRFGWGTLVLILTLGLYTVPTMLFPFAILYVWFLQVIISKDFGASYTSQWDLLRYTIISGALTGISTAMLYLPIIIFHPDYLFNHRWLEKVPLNMLFDQMKGKVIINWHVWFDGVPTWLMGVGVIGILISFLAHRQLAKHQLPLQFAFAVGIVAVLLVQRPNNPWARVWAFSIPFFMVWAAAGIIEPLKKRNLQNILLGIALTASVWGAWQAAQTPVEPSKESLVAAYLAPILQDGDMILIDGGYAAPVEYYLTRLGKAGDYFQRRDDFERAFLVVVTKGDENLEDFLEKYVPKYSLDMNSLTPLYSYGNYEMYEMFPLP